MTTGIFSYSQFIPLSQIRSVRFDRNKHDQEMATVRMLDGEIIREAETWEKFGEIPVQIMPCEPGWSLLHAWTDGDDASQWELGRTPLIGWALCADGEIRPVTPSGVNDGSTEPRDIGNFVEAPNGRVCSTSSWAFRSSFDDAAAFFSYALEERGKRPAVPSPEGAAS